MLNHKAEDSISIETGMLREQVLCFFWAAGKPTARRTTLK